MMCALKLKIQTICVNESKDALVNNYYHVSNYKWHGKQVDHTTDCFKKKATIS